MPAKTFNAVRRLNRLSQHAPKPECLVTDLADSNPNPPERSDSDHAAARIVVRSEDLLQGQREVAIQHGEETYRLRVTKTGKLILNK